MTKYVINNFARAFQILARRRQRSLYPAYECYGWGRGS